MKNILFFTQNRWAFGSIHHALCKELYKHSIFANVLDWTYSYTHEEFEHLNRVYDLFVTNPEAVMQLHKTYKIPLNKISSVAHAQWDILLAKQNSSYDFYSELYSFGVISQTLKEKCIEWQMSQIPKVTELGLCFDVLYEQPAKQLKIIGYGGANETYNFFGVEIKRPKLIETTVGDITGVMLKKHSFYNHLCMPGYYKTVDSVVMSSIEEAGGLPMMECAAAGRLPIGTPVGYFKDNAPAGGGILLPLEPAEFSKELKQHLEFYRDNNNEYVNKCLEAQAYARDHYDWSKKINQWLEILV
jgi:glycosyltransferase involved in cell wall biosynthesis